MAHYRRRRGGSEPGAESDDNLEFDFAGPLVGSRGQPDRRDEQDQELDVVLERDESENDAPALDTVQIQRGSASGLRPEDAAEWALEPSDFTVAGPEPLEISLDGRTDAQDELDDRQELISGGRMRLAAPIGVRVSACVLDGVILLVSAGLFGIVFRETGGRITLGTHGSGATNLMLLALLAAVLLLFYFGIFTALAFATPGQAALGLRVRTLDNQPPDARAARLRAFGYLLSAAALMMGFVWAVFDVDGLAWHDRVSGTCLVRWRS